MHARCFVFFLFFFVGGGGIGYAQGSRRDKPVHDTGQNQWQVNNRVDNMHGHS